MDKTLTKTITLDGIEVALRASGATPILYRTLFHKDLIVSFNKLILRQGEDQDETNPDELPDGAIELLMEAAYVMARQADKNERRPFEEWLDQFSFMGLAQDVGKVADILIDNDETIDEAKKNEDQQIED